MPDITMCEGVNCPINDKCYRFTATPSEYHQSYFASEPYITSETDEGVKVFEECDYFIPNKKR